MKNSYLYSGALIGIVITSRLLPHPPNFSPISALLLLLPLFFPRERFAQLSVFVGLFVSDLFLGMYGAAPYVYGSFLLIAGIGRVVKKHETNWKFLLLPIISSFLFYTITNFGVWATTSMYAHDLSGLLQSYWMGIPFLKYSLMGDNLYFYGLVGIFTTLKLTMNNRERLDCFQTD